MEKGQECTEVKVKDLDGENKIIDKDQKAIYGLVDCFFIFKFEANLRKFYLYVKMIFSIC